MTTSRKSYRVVIVDDHQIFTEGFERLIEIFDFLVFIKSYNNPEKFLKELPDLNVEVVFMDIEMPEMNGYDVTKEALKIKPDLKVITVSMCSDGYSAKRMLEVGACAYMTKSLTSDKIIEVFNCIENSEKYIAPEVKLNQVFQTGEMDLNISSNDITIIQLLSIGKTAQEIAEKLEISEKTVESEKNKLYKKFNVNSAIELVAMAFKLKILK